MSAETPVDYEDLTSMKLDEAALRGLVDGGGECIFNWTTKDGYPVGVVVAYIYRDGKFAHLADSAGAIAEAENIGKAIVHEAGLSHRMANNWRT